MRCPNCRICDENTIYCALPKFIECPNDFVCLIDLKERNPNKPNIDNEIKTFRMFNKSRKE